jgi:hypothetical protein
VNIYEAARFINAMALRPGWDVTAVPYDGKVLATFTLQTFNSNEMFAPDYERGDPFTRPVQHLIDVPASMTRATLAAEVLRLICETEIHEHMEFTRYYDDTTGRYVAPCHPHRPEGESNWLTGRAMPRLRECLTA